MISSFSGSKIVDENICPTSKVLECTDHKQTKEYIGYKPSQLRISLANLGLAKARELM
jgi:hypothetical protein